MSDIIKEITKEYQKSEKPEYEVGDTVDVSVKIVEGDKERIQVFGGVVIAKKNSGIAETVTVRRIVGGEGVERVFPIHAPSVVSVKVLKRAKVRRAKLYYLRERTGKSARLKEKRGAIAPKHSGK